MALILFDKDNTLVRTEQISIDSAFEALSSFADQGLSRLQSFDADFVHQLVFGRSILEIIDEISECYLVSSHHRQAFADDYEARYLAKKAQSDDFFIDEAVALLDWAHTSPQHHAAIVSGSTRSDIQNDIADMKRKGGIRCDDIMYWGAEDYTQGKPSPMPYLLAFEHFAKQHDLIKDECIVIEDSMPGVRSAKSAGFYTIALNETGALPIEAELVAAGADEIHNRLNLEKIIALADAKSKVRQL